jgi:alpha-N-arabinofuranosidase
VKARITLDSAFDLGEIDPRISGSFVEHLGRCVYGGIFEPGHPDADEHGFRRDVLELVRELAVPIVRYPGGNFVSNYLWEDGIGRRADRPRRLDPAWHSIETNAFGLGEFMTWCDLVGTAPMLAVNLGTRGVREACDLLEYANFPGGTRWSDLRRAHGASDPFDVRVWCLGNELDGPWQIGHKTAAEYGRLASETARAMRRIDPGLELVACGSSHAAMPTYPEWEATVLDHCYDEVDYLSLHTYAHPDPDDVPTFLGFALEMDAFIDAVVATCDFVRTKKRSKKVMRLSFDEWNVWYLARATERPPWWQEAPALFEDAYDIADAVVVGSLLNSLVRHADRVKIACVAQLVNVIAPIHTRNGGGAWREATFFPLRDVARYARGRSLATRVDVPTYPSARHDAVPFLDCSASLDDADGALVIFAANRSLTEPVELALDLRGVGTCTLIEHSTLADGGPYVHGAAINTEDVPDRVLPRSVPIDPGRDGELTVTLPALSWNVLRLVRADAR